MVSMLEGCRVQTCCGCLPVRTGTLIIGVIFLISTILELCKYIVMMIILETGLQLCHQKTFKDSDSSMETEEFPLPGVENSTLKCRDFKHINSYRFLFCAGIMMYAVQLILTSLMIHGAKTGKPKMMSPWLLWTLVYISYGILNFIGFSRHANSLALMFACVGLPFYFFLVVNSYYLQLREGGQQSVVSVLAVTRPNQDMHVILPTMPLHHKEDPPPPYPGFAPDSDPPPYTPYPGSGHMSRSPSPGATTIEVQPSSSATSELHGATANITIPNESQPIVSKPTLPPA